MHRPRTSDLLPPKSVIPVVTLARAEDAVPLAEALLAGGVKAIEITLRTDAAFAAAEAIARHVPGVVLGIGTCVEPDQFARARDAGARFLVSPGFTPALDTAAAGTGLPWLPGVATASEALAARAAGHRELKLFPANVAGGPGMLSALGAILPDLRFCPTGGVTADNLAAYRDLPNVFAVGGSWLAPADALRERRWDLVEAAAKVARTALG
ncbi:MAG TPA: bifunctional 4-hydroxy-2-oxoglutarate aldolase/2-dehydro-3-deoxy-phosphogluconate aldolase [Azospirillaceae bacterium]|nr:bifunctional 4-hydroxy-2-oxoglutarate aldolase/2-dehydro-3-deoxy-phosphogluconate aldolase [Azospirillaceae bacterium]